MQHAATARSTPDRHRFEARVRGGGLRGRVQAGQCGQVDARRLARQALAAGRGKLGPEAEDVLLAELREPRPKRSDLGHLDRFPPRFCSKPIRAHLAQVSESETAAVYRADYAAGGAADTPEVGRRTPPRAGAAGAAPGLRGRGPAGRSFRARG